MLGQGFGFNEKKLQLPDIPGLGPKQLLISEIQVVLFRELKSNFNLMKNGNSKGRALTLGI